MSTITDISGNKVDKGWDGEAKNGLKLEDYIPLHNGVLALSKSVSRKTDSGIYKSKAQIEREEASMRDDRHYDVVKVGKDVKNIKVGDKIWVGRISPYPVTLDGDLYDTFFENWVIGIHREGISLDDIVDTTNVGSSHLGH